MRNPFTLGQEYDSNMTSTKGLRRSDPLVSQEIDQFTGLLAHTGLTPLARYVTISVGSQCGRRFVPRSLATPSPRRLAAHRHDPTPPADCIRHCIPPSISGVANSDRPSLEPMKLARQIL